MGYENRDYFRDGSYTSNVGSGGGALSRAPICQRIIIITAVVFVAQIIFVRSPNVNDLRRMVSAKDAAEIEAANIPAEQILQNFPLNRVSIVDDWLELDTYRVVYQGQVWRLVTSAFLHSRFQVTHILFNMMVLYFFGTYVESKYGSREFLLIYLAGQLLQV